MEPLVDGALRERAQAWIDACAAKLADPDWSRFATAHAHLPDPDVRVARRASLSGGCAGAAILFHRLGRADEVHALLTRAIETLGSVGMETGLLKGITGIAWTVNLLGGAEGDEDPLAEIDEALVAAIGDPDPYFDHGNGLAGVGVYLLDRLPRAGASEALARVVARLTELAAAGPVWRLANRTQVNLGIAHGMAGVIAFLAGVVTARAQAPGAAALAQPLLERAVVWLIAQAWNERSSRFPAAVDPDSTPIAARHGWCEGDLGIAIALARAGRATGSTAWIDEARRTARVAARRTADEGGVVDVGLCHGAAGIAHLLHRLYRLLGDAELGDAARLWFGRTLDMIRSRPGFVVLEGNRPDVASPGLLVGATGVALALEAATGMVEPTWDRALGLS